MKPKITIIGAGNVGATIAMLLAQKNWTRQIVLIDRNENMAKGKALDIHQATGSIIIGASEPQFMVGSDVVVIAAGKPRQPGMSRNDLLQVNGEIIREIAPLVAWYAPIAKVIVITNPVDIMTYLFQDISQMPRNKVMGLSGELDSMRMRRLMSERLRVPYNSVTALVIGAHSNLMLPLPSLSFVGHKTLTESTNAEALAYIIDHTRNGGTEIVDLLKTGAAYYAPAVATVRMVHALISYPGRFLLSSVYHEGIFIGLPAVLNEDGALPSDVPPLTANEYNAWTESQRSIKTDLETMYGAT